MLERQLGVDARRDRDNVVALRLRGWLNTLVSKLVSSPAVRGGSWTSDTVARGPHRGLRSDLLDGLRVRRMARGDEQRHEQARDQGPLGRGLSPAAGASSTASRGASSRGVPVPATRPPPAARSGRPPRATPAGGSPRRWSCECTATVAPLPPHVQRRRAGRSPRRARAARAGGEVPAPTRPAGARRPAAARRGRRLSCRGRDRRGGVEHRDPRLHRGPRPTRHRPITAGGKAFSGRSCDPRGGPNTCLITARTTPRRARSSGGGGSSRDQANPATRSGARCRSRSVATPRERHPERPRLAIRVPRYDPYRHVPRIHGICSGRTLTGCPDIESQVEREYRDDGGILSMSNQSGRAGPGAVCEQSWQTL